MKDLPVNVGVRAGAACAVVGLLAGAGVVGNSALNGAEPQPRLVSVVSTPVAGDAVGAVTAAAVVRQVPAAGRAKPVVQAFPGVGAGVRKRIAGSRQVVLVQGADNAGRAVSVSLWQRSSAGVWKRTGGPWAGHIGRNGWGKQRRGDSRSPIGVFTLTQAGGTLAKPKGARLPYHRSSAYTYASGFGRYVIRVDYNVAAKDMGRNPKSTPGAVDWKGSGIWLHVDNGRPTGGCTSVSLGAMRTILKALDPGKRPVFVAGPPRFLSK